MELTESLYKIRTNFFWRNFKKGCTHTGCTDIKCDTDLFLRFTKKHYGSIVARILRTPEEDASSFIIRNFPISRVWVTCGPPHSSREKQAPSLETTNKLLS